MFFYCCVAPDDKKKTAFAFFVFYRCAALAYLAKNNYR